MTSVPSLKLSNPDEPKAGLQGNFIMDEEDQIESLRTELLKVNDAIYTLNEKQMAAIRAHATAEEAIQSTMKANQVLRRQAVQLKAQLQGVIPMTVNGRLKYGVPGAMPSCKSMSS